MPCPFRLNPTLLESLHCPLCGGPIVTDRGEPIEFGVVSCLCSEYPVVGGIIVIEREGRGAALLAALESGSEPRIDAVTYGDFEAPGPLLRNRSADFRAALAEYQRLCPRDAARELEWLIHCDYWRATPKYLAALRLLPYVADAATGPVADLGCGLGHLSALYSGLLGQRRQYLLDESLLYLTLARSLLSDEQRQRTCLIWTRIDGALPFAPHSMSLILSCDAFYAFREQAAVLRSCRKALSDRGRMLFTHLHNSGRPDEPFQDYSHSARHWQELFEDNIALSVELVSDEVLRLSLLSGGALELGAEAQDNPRSFSALAPAVKRLECLPEDPPIGGDLQINPVYEILDEGRTLLLTRRPLSQLFTAEHETERFFPNLRIDKSSLTERHQRRLLYRRGVLVAGTWPAESNHVMDLRSCLLQRAY